jgi:hypothetical protein
MALIVVRENQTVRGVEMSEKNEPIWNIVKILFATFVLLLVWNSAFGQTTTIRMFVNGAENPRPVVLMTEKLASVKVTITNNETGEEKEITTEEEPDCE